MSAENAFFDRGLYLTLFLLFLLFLFNCPPVVKCVFSLAVLCFCPGHGYGMVMTAWFVGGSMACECRVTLLRDWYTLLLGVWEHIDYCTIQHVLRVI